MVVCANQFSSDQSQTDSQTSQTGSYISGSKMSPTTSTQNSVDQYMVTLKSKNCRKKNIGSQKVKDDTTPSSPESQSSVTRVIRDRNQRDEDNKATKEARCSQNLSKVINLHKKSNCFIDSNENTKMFTTGEISNANVSNESDATTKIKAMSQERESLLAEVEQFRRSLEDIQERHGSDLDSIKNQHTEESSKIKTKFQEEIFLIQQKHTEEILKIKTELEDSVAARNAAETQYQNLLERVNTIKSSLGERFKADRQELAEAKTQIEKLELEKNFQEEKIKDYETEIGQLGIERLEFLKEISTMRDQYNISQHNLSQLREQLTKQTSQLKDEVVAAKEAKGEWELLAMEERSIREGLMVRVKDLEDQILSQKEALQSAILERENYLQTTENLRQNFQNIQDSQRKEFGETVDSYKSQLHDLEKLVVEVGSRADEAESSKSSLQAELERLAPLEKELKEKNLLIGKLRHEAIILNDHLTKALKFIKKAKPEDNIDRQIVTNHFLHFLTLDRSDPKKFQVLQLIASLLNWTDEQKEQAGLARPGTSNLLHRLPPTNFNRTPSTPSLSTEFFNETSAKRESLAELWKGFLERSTEQGELKHNGSMNIFSTPKTKNEI